MSGLIDLYLDRAHHLEAKGLWQTEAGFDAHAARSFRKARYWQDMADWQVAFTGDYVLD